LNQAETEKLLNIIQKAYPNYFKDFDSEAFDIQAKLWERSLADYTYRDVINAFEYWFSTEDRPPTLPKFKPIIIKFINPQAFISPERAWEAVDLAVRKFGSYNQEKAFATFSEPIKRAVRSVGGWQKICSTELGRDWDFLKKNFIDAFNDFDQDVKEQELLPTSVLQRLNEIQPKQLESPK
jgi:hypothetical protein